LEVDDATWVRGRGHALSQAAIFIPYYLHSNPVGVANAQRQIEAVLDDFRADMLTDDNAQSLPDNGG